MFLVLVWALAIQLLPVVTARGQQMLDPASNNTTMDCPPWTHFDGTSCLCSIPKSKTSTARCKEGDNSTLLLTPCYCLSYYRDLNLTVYGNCIYSCSLERNSNRYTMSNLDNGCAHGYNRRAEMCGKCMEGTGHPLYSYSLKCVACSNDTTAILQYAAAAFLPLTVFYVGMVTFRVSATAEKLSGYILMSQIFTTPAQLRYIASLSANKPGTVAIRLGLAVHAVWNLDFFRGMYAPFCYSDAASAMLVSSLEYLIALYPLGLILLTYCLVNLHDRCRLVARVWRPAHDVFNRIRHRCNVRKSLVDVFTTFLLLSYIKILNASFDILLPTTLHDLTGEVVSSRYLYYDGTMRSFSGGHVKYGVLALTMLLTFNVLPLLTLLLYPSKTFQRLLNRCGCSSRFQVVHTLMDSFTGCYRTSPSLDCRYFAGVNLLVRIVNLVIFSTSLSRYYYTFGCVLFVVMAGVITVVKPYKSPAQNTTDVALYLVYAVGYIAATAYALSPDPTYNTVLVALMGLAGTLSVLYVVVLVLHGTFLKLLVPMLRSCPRLSLRGCRLLPGNGTSCCHDDDDTAAEDAQACRLDEELFRSSMNERDESRPLLSTLKGGRK